MTPSPKGTSAASASGSGAGGVSAGLPAGAAADRGPRGRIHTAGGGRPPMESEPAAFTGHSAIISLFGLR